MLTVPRPVNRCIGRDDELLTLRQWLDDPHQRLINLCGPGGIGKTRLALEFAHQIKQHTQLPQRPQGPQDWGVVFVGLGSLTSHHNLCHPIASALGLTDCESPDFLDRLAGTFCAPKSWLLVLDNFEHLSDQAPLLATMLAEIAQLKILVTSRSPLRLQGERVLTIPALPLDTAAIPLFLERAKQIRPDLDLHDAQQHLVEEVCRALEGLPLALELAASRLDLLSLQEVHSRLSQKLTLLGDGPLDASPRHRTMRAAIDWSYELLSPIDRLVYRWLSPFAGGVDLQNLLDHHWNDFTDLQLHQSVSRLLRQNLLSRSQSQHGRTRLRFMEVLREHANERLEQAGEVDEAFESFSDLMVKIVHHCHQLYRSGHQAQALEELGREEQNALNSLAWLSNRNDQRSGQMVENLGWYWESTGSLAEGRRWADKSGVWSVAATMARHQGDYPAAQRYYDQALQNTQDPQARDAILCGLAENAYRQGQVPWALELYNQVAQTSQHPNLCVSGLLGVSRCLWAQDLAQSPQALQILEKASALATKLENSTLQAWAHNFTGEVYRGLGQFGLALQCYQTASQLFAKLADHGPLAIVEQNAASAHLAQENPQAAAPLLESAFRYWYRCGSRHGLCLSLMGCAGYARASGQAQIARKFWGYSQGLLAQLSCSLDPSDRLEHERLRAVFDDSLATLNPFVGQASLDEILAAVEDLFRRPPEKTTHTESKDAITPREMEVLSLLSQGLSNADIGQKLHISRHTVTVHLRTIYEKLGLHNRSEATRWYLLHQSH